MKSESCFRIAYILKPHGLKGETTLTLLPECPDLAGIKSVFVEINSQLVPFFIESASVKGTRAYVKFEGVDTAESANELKGCELFLSLKDRPALHKGEFYNDEVTGFEVSDTQHGPLGTVHGVQDTGTVRHLVIHKEGKEILIPINGPFIKQVNRSRKLIVVEVPEGLLDL